MDTYNDIGIRGELDWPRIRKLMLIGLAAACMVLAGDMLLGWGVEDEDLSGLERMLSAYLGLSDRRIFASAMLGLIGIPLEGLCYFSVYRLIVPYSERYAHLYRTGILGYLVFGACGVHVPCLACVFFYKHMVAASPETALAVTMRFAAYFLLPGTILLLVFLVIHSAAQVSAFAKGLTPYPRWCWVFSLPVGMAATALLSLLGNHAIFNAITAGWMSVGNIWMFAGLLMMMGKAEARSA